MRTSTGWRAAFGSLENRNYRWYWFSSTSAAAAMNMQLFARGWFIYDLTDSPMAIGWVSFGAGIPLLLLSPFAGAIAERWEKRNVMIITQLLTSIMLLSVAVLISIGAIVWWHLVVASVANGVILSFNIPARQAVVPHLVEERRVMNAIALASGSENLNRVLAPALGGILISTIDIDGVYYLMVALSVVAAMLLSFVSPVGKRLPDAGATVRRDVSEGLAYVRSSPALRGLIVMALVPLLFGMPYMMLLPIFAKDVLEVGSDGLDYLTGAAGIGAFAGSFLLASMGDYRRKGLFLFVAAILFGVSLALFAGSTHFGVSLMLLLIVGMASSTYMATNTTLLLLNSEDKMRGRVMSLNMMSIAVFPIAVLPMTAAIQSLDAPLVVGVGGIIITVFALIMAFSNPTVRRL